MADKEYIERDCIVDSIRKSFDVYYQIPIDSSDREVQNIVNRVKRIVQEIPAANVVELPLNIGDVVYFSRPWYKNGALLPHQITCLTITQNKKKQWCKKYRAHLLENGKTKDIYVSFSFDEIGKEVFLTNVVGERKEATP